MNLKGAVDKLEGVFPIPGITDFAVPAYINIATTLMRWLPPAVSPKVLDFGCGLCDKTALLAFLGYHCSGYDDFKENWHKREGNTDKILAFASRVGLDVRTADSDVLPWSRQSFDVVMLNDVLEHFHDSPREMLNKLLDLLKDDGLLLITVPNAVNLRKRLDVLRGRTNMPEFNRYYWFPGPWRGHVREYTAGDLTALARNCGVEIMELRGCDHMIRKLPAPLRPVYSALTLLFPAWKDSWTLLAKKPACWRRRDLTPEQVSELLENYSVASKNFSIWSNS